MKEDNNKKNNEKWSFGIGLALGVIGAWLIASKNSRPKNKINNNDFLNSKEVISQSYIGDNLENDTQAVPPLIWGSGEKFQDFVKGNKFLSPEPYCREDVIEIISRYVKRAINVKIRSHRRNNNRDTTEVKKQNEPLVIYLPHDIIKGLLNVVDPDDPNYDKGGLMAIFAIDTISQPNKVNKNQTFVLMRYGHDGRAIIQDNATYAVERWDAQDKKLSAIISNDDGGNIDLDDIIPQIDNYLKSDIQSKG